MDTVTRREMYSPNTWKYRVKWGAKNGGLDVNSVNELFDGRIEEGWTPPRMMDKHISAEEFVALFEWLPDNNTSVKEYRNSNGELYAAIFDLTMTGKQRSDWFFD